MLFKFINIGYPCSILGHICNVKQNGKIDSYVLKITN